jgi:zinc D-Ala-D-Ala carboxypeptidase
MKTILLLVFLQVGMLSQFVSKKEAYYSPLATKLGIKNTPTARQEQMVIRFCRDFFDPLRIKLGSPIYFNSFFRSPPLNEAVGGASASDHMILGDVVAADLDNDGKAGTISNADLFHFIRNESPAGYYKIIWEFGSSTAPAWVHVGWSTDPAKNRMQRAYRAIRVNNRTVYEIFK